MKQIAIILLFFLTLPLMSQDLTSVDIFNRIAAHPLVQADYTQKKTIVRLNKDFYSSGRVLFNESHGIAWLTTTPFPSQTLLNQQGLTQISASGERRNISAEGNETFVRFAQTIQSVFLGNMDYINEEYRVKLNMESSDKWSIHLEPKDQGLLQIVKGFEISGNAFIEEFIIQEAGGDSIVYQFSKIEFPQTFSPEDQRVFQ